MRDTVLKTKLRPPRPRRDLVPRRYLYERLDEGRREGRHLTVVSAPAGAGKTTTVASWLRGYEIPFVWLSLDPGDDDPVRFWSHVLAAVEQRHPGFGAVCRELLPSPERPQWEEWLTLLVNEWEALDEPLVLVIDDLHLVDDESIHGGLRFLVEHPPWALHLVLVSRGEPRLPLPRLRVRDQLTELGGDDLGLSSEECGALIEATAGVALDDTQTAEIRRRTEGWAAGVQLAALSLGRATSVDALVHRFGGAHHLIAEYLVSEVLEALDDELERFVLDTAVLGRFDGDLADAALATTGSRERIDTLLRDNVFVVALDDERAWVRYHHLFAEMLTARTERADAPRATEIRRRAVAWYLDREIPEEAFVHAIAGEAYDLAGDVIRREAFELLTKGELATLARHLGAIPAEVVEGRPWLLVFSAYLALATGRWQEMPGLVARALHLVAEGHPDDDDPELSSNIDLIRAMLANGRGEAEEALALVLGAEARLPSHCIALRSILRRLAGEASLGAGKLREAEEAFGDIGRGAAAVGNRLLQASAAIDQGRICLVEGRLGDARARYGEARAILDSPGLAETAMAAAAMLGAAYLEHARGDSAGAQTLVERAMAQLGPSANPAHVLMGLAVSGQVSLALGDVGAAEGALEGGLALRRQVPGMTGGLVTLFDMPVVRHWLATGRAARAGALVEELGHGVVGPPYLRELGTLVRARVLLPDAPEEARRLLEPLAKAAHEQGRQGLEASVAVLLARAALDQGDPRGAEELVTVAKAWARREDALQLLLDEGAPLVPLLATDGPPADHGDQPAAPSARERANQGLPEPLSPRELEVLDLLAEGLSNREIAGRLFVSVGTVKTHVHHISAKLDAERRTQAVANARSLGLL